MSSVPTSPFSLQQKIFTLSWLSNRTAGKVGLGAPLQARAVTLIDAGSPMP
jgi:hypothetical protein